MRIKTLRSDIEHGILDTWDKLLRNPRETTEQIREGKPTQKNRYAKSASNILNILDQYMERNQSN